MFIQYDPHRIDFSDSPFSRLQNYSIQYGNHSEIHSDIGHFRSDIQASHLHFQTYSRISANRLSLAKQANSSWSDQPPFDMADFRPREPSQPVNPSFHEHPVHAPHTPVRIKGSENYTPYTSATAEKEKETTAPLPLRISPAERFGNGPRLPQSLLSHLSNNKKEQRTTQGAKHITRPSNHLRARQPHPTDSHHPRRSQHSVLVLTPGLRHNLTPSTSQAANILWKFIFMFRISYLVFCSNWGTPTCFWKHQQLTRSRCDEISLPASFPRTNYDLDCIILIRHFKSSHFACY
eukprot:g32550.t1